MGDKVALLTLTSAYMEGKDVIYVEFIINGHRHYKPSAALCTNMLSAVSYLVIRLILSFVLRKCRNFKWYFYDGGILELT